MSRDWALQAVFVGAVLTMFAEPARAQEYAVELGASLASLNVGVGEVNDFTTLSVPASGFGTLNPGVYASVFVGPRLSIEPQIGFVVASGGEGDTFHIVNVAGQVNYFLKGTAQSSPYVFGSVGILDYSGGSGDNPVSVSGGAGYRIRVGTRLTFRFDGRYTHFTEDTTGDAVAFTVSIGGLLGER